MCIRNAISIASCFLILTVSFYTTVSAKPMSEREEISNTGAMHGALIPIVENCSGRKLNKVWKEKFPLFRQKVDLIGGWRKKLYENQYSKFYALIQKKIKTHGRYNFCGGVSVQIINGDKTYRKYLLD